MVRVDICMHMFHGVRIEDIEQHLDKKTGLGRDYKDCAAGSNF